MATDTERFSAESTLKELHAYAKLLFLRSGRQLEEKVPYQENEDEVSQDESANDGNSLINVPLSNLDTDLLRRRFLDRLSETVSSTKGGRHVVASYMVYWPDKVKVFVAINSKFSDGDALPKFLDNLCISLREIATAAENESQKHMDTLWNTLIRHQYSRLNASIVDLRQIMKDFQQLLSEGSSSEPTVSTVPPDTDLVILDFEDSLKLLARLLFVNSESDLERHKRLVALSHALYRTFPAEKFQALGRRGEKLRQEIGFLGRLQTSFHDLIAAARQISGFEDLFLIPVVKAKTLKKNSSKEWNLARTFDALKIQLSDTAIEKLMKPSSTKTKWTKNKLVTNFSRLKSPTWEVHVEIQLIIFILSHPDDVANGKRVDYIGCSSWTLPSGDKLGKDEQEALYGAAREVISWMRKELVGSRISSAQRRAEVKESTIGGSLMSILGTSEEIQHQSQAISEHLRRQRAQNSHGQSIQKRFVIRRAPVTLLNFLNEEASRVEARYETLNESTMDLWGLFCNENCERKMPLSHLLKCNIRQVTSADYLYEDVLDDTVPTDPQVRQDYWFDRCQTSHEESHLLGLFIGLLRHSPYRITREVLHEWRLEPGGNTYLVKKIAEKFEELPQGSRGGYFPWFMRHRNRFEIPAGHESIPRAPSPMTKAQNMQAKAWKYLAPEDQSKDFMELTPFSKFHCFGFYSMNLGNAYPPPMNHEVCHWFNFGFVVCQDQHEEDTLCRMYNTMLFGSTSQLEYEESLGSSQLDTFFKKRDPACTFDEFWKAWESGKLMTIFNRCWPELTTENAYKPAEYILLDRLRIFIEAEAPLPSIWRLRHFLAMKDVSVESAAPEIACAARDYGFSENLDTRTTIELRTFYVDLLKKADPMEAHRERMKGNLRQFAERHVDGMTLRIRNLLQDL
ncbi:hypothetical protein FBEOM_14658 [Fusarium beomiforme]|uniref:Uncharacterized protein n=1 Tax=Fusarium beomiforme TaxID=44412 RepID=A0A9P5A308_9HYPO|nr:hypothetical protein FBEOM_14658 [Fusarium beomiforme]